MAGSHIDFPFRTADNAGMTHHISKPVCSFFVALFLSVSASRLPADESAPAEKPAAADQVAAAAAATPQTTSLSPELLQVLHDLGATQYAVRSQASERLKEFSAQQIGELAAAAVDQPSAEVVVRIQAEIEARYTSEDPQDVAVASQALESSADVQRLVLADQARQSLRQHWRKRVDLATADLQQHGAIIREGSFTNSGMLPGFAPNPSREALQVLITETWKGGDEGVAIFERLTALCGPLRVTDGGINVFLIGGNPLTDEQESRLIDLVGQNRVVKRSRVALGIQANRGMVRQGVLIDRVSPGSSAEAAGLLPGDLIIAIEDPAAEKAKPEEDKQAAKPIPVDPDAGEDLFNLEKDKTLLRDFDDLVDRLMDYRQGDTMTVRVIRGFRPNRIFGVPDRDEDRPPGLQIEVVKIKMKGWEDLTIE